MSGVCVRVCVWWYPGTLFVRLCIPSRCSQECRAARQQLARRERRQAQVGRQLALGLPCKEIRSIHPCGPQRFGWAAEIFALEKCSDVGIAPVSSDVLPTGRGMAHSVTSRAFRPRQPEYAPPPAVKNTLKECPGSACDNL